MLINYALPIGHQLNKDYSAFLPAPNKRALVRGRRFRQPIKTAPDAGNFSHGIEIFALAARNPVTDGAVGDLYAVCNGALRWLPPSADSPVHRLMLSIDSADWRIKGGKPRVAMIQAPLGTVGYDNVAEAQVRAAMERLLRQAFENAEVSGDNPILWHPSMHSVIFDGHLKRTLKFYLSSRIYSKKLVEPEIQKVVQAFLTTSAFPEGLGVSAGDLIGQAAPYLANDPLPDLPFSPGGPTDPERARRVTIWFADHGDQIINPAHYLYHFHRRPELKLLTVLPAGGYTTHPFSALLPDPAQGEPSPREFINGQTPIPLGALTSYRSFPRERQSKHFVWRCRDDGAFEVSTRHKIALPNLSGSQHEKRVEFIWDQYGKHISSIAGRLQIPCELIVAILGREALVPPQERAVRPEHLIDAKHRKAVNDKGATLLTEYDKLTGRPFAITNIKTNGNTVLDIRFEGKASLSTEQSIAIGRATYKITSISVGKEITDYQIKIKGVVADAKAGVLLSGTRLKQILIPYPWNGAAVVAPGFSALTWDQFAQVVELTQGLRASPGLMQTLISTAKEQVELAKKIDPTLFEIDDVTEPPTSVVAYLKNWLLRPVNSILAGALYLRHHYNRVFTVRGKRLTTSYELPLLAAAYNLNQLIVVDEDSWGLKTHPGYIAVAAAHYNAAVIVFRGLEEPPEVQFRL
ncbi:MAG TPA: hypothetical protein VJ810_29265 [Blastocatellia bacterium]|nr:hypothetical protein [Blastocatellia bacterium]